MLFVTCIGESLHRRKKVKQTRPKNETYFDCWGKDKCLEGNHENTELSLRLKMLREQSPWYICADYCVADKKLCIKCKKFFSSFQMNPKSEYIVKDISMQWFKCKLTKSLPVLQTDWTGVFWIAADRVF